MPSNIFNIIAGVIAIVAGINMAFTKAVGANSLLETLINGVGWYCIARGVFMISSTANLKSTLHHLLDKQNAQTKVCTECMGTVHDWAKKCRHCGSDLQQKA